MPACRAFLKDHCKWGSFCRYRHVNKDDMPVCTFFLKGMCKHGDSCSFRHSQLDDDIPACTFFLEGRCRNSSESCTFRHVEDTEDVHSQESFGEEESHEGTPDMASTMAGAPAVSSNATSINEDRDSNTDVTGDGFSMVPLVDHLVEIAGGIVELKELLRLYLSALGAAVDEDCDVTLASFDSGMGPAKRKAQKLLKARSDAGDPTAQYLWGKLLECQQVIVLDKTGSQSNAALKVWMMSAQSGHAMAMARLGLMHRNEGEQSTANHWWEKAICVAEMPEASYNLGVSFGLGQNGNPINYSTAAMYYAHTADINLDSYRSKGFTKVFEKVMLDMIGPNNDEQSEYQNLAKSNLVTVEKYLAYPEDAPHPGGATRSRHAMPDYECSESDALCSGCERRRKAGEKKLLACSRCKSVWYCNSLCQKGHWRSHKTDCQPSAL
jgi:hypothetical protein